MTQTATPEDTSPLLRIDPVDLDQYLGALTVVIDTWQHPHTGVTITFEDRRPGGKTAEHDARPWAWWVFDRGFEAEPCEAEAIAYLTEHGLLTDRERQQLGR